MGDRFLILGTISLRFSAPIPLFAPPLFSFFDHPPMGVAYLVRTKATLFFVTFLSSFTFPSLVYLFLTPGGSGFIGRHLVKYLFDNKLASKVWRLPPLPFFLTLTCRCVLLTRCCTKLLAFLVMSLLFLRTRTSLPSSKLILPTLVCGHRQPVELTAHVSFLRCTL